MLSQAECGTKINTEREGYGPSLFRNF